jgi:hypothetical protein
MKQNSNPQPTGWLYVGNGAYIPGVPARNLSVDEMKEYAEIIDGSALYEAVYVEQPVVFVEKEQ